jgi:sensor domain CHASE-containing protein
MSDAVLVAVIGGGFSVVVALVELMRRQNGRDHGIVTHKLDTLHEGHQRLEAKIDTHINDHAKGEFQ